jgi:dihydrofolate reductase
MGRIVISENISLDGVIQDPTGEEGYRLAGWFDQLDGNDRAAWAKAQFEEALSAEGLLMGRRTYEWFVARGWPSREGAWGDRLRSLPKYVVSSTLQELDWTNSTIVNGDVANEVSELTRLLSDDIVVYGSGRLVHWLIERDLVDELRLMICPFVLGEGERVFGNFRVQRSLRLVDSRTVGQNLVLLTYQHVRDAARSGAGDRT